MILRLTNRRQLENKMTKIHNLMSSSQCKILSDNTLATSQELLQHNLDNNSTISKIIIQVKLLQVETNSLHSLNSNICNSEQSHRRTIMLGKVW